MRSHAPFEPIVTKFCVWGRVVDVITDAKFYRNWLRFFGVTGPLPHMPFPIFNVHHLYNSVSTTVLHCDRCWYLFVIAKYLGVEGSLFLSTQCI